MPAVTPRRLAASLGIFALLAVVPAALAAADDDLGGDGPRIMREADAAERAGRRAEARQLYLDAAKQNPLVAEWLLRRAARLTPDSAERAAILERLRTPVVAARGLQTEAAARELAGDLKGALVRYDSLGRIGDFTRLRLKLARTAAERSRIRQELVATLAESPRAAALDALFAASLVPTPREALVAARAATLLGQPAREVVLYRRAVAARLATPEDRFAYGLALSRTRRHSEALTVFTGITTPASLAKRAQVHRALAQVRVGRDAAAHATLKRLLAKYPDDSIVTPPVLFLAGGVEARLGHRDLAREHWTRLATTYPASDSAGRAGFLAALILWEAGDRDGAAREWEHVHQLDGGADGLAAGYWAGRAYDELGERKHAELLWQSVIARDPMSYYASVSARRLDVPAWRPVAAPDSFPLFTDVNHAVRRIQILTEGGFTQEVQWEREWLLNDQQPDAERLLAAADGFRRIGQPSVAVSFARRAQRAGAPDDARTYRLLYPLAYTGELERQASATGLDPFVLAALIRQESAWEPRARSRAGAMGLMQVMPETGRLLARGLGLAGWRADHLHDPEVNVRLGSHYLAQTVQRFDGDLVRGLAAYNAGPGRVVAWTAGAESFDPDLFVEKITFTETRDYVRIVQRNVAIYRALYGEGKAAQAAREAADAIN